MTMNPAENRSHWLSEEQKLDERIHEAVWPGGQKAVDRLAKQGKQPVRQLIEKLVDPGTPFFELSTIAGFGVNYPGGIDDVPCGGLVTGIGKINGKHWAGIITYREGNIRIISVRRARTEEVELYES